jgi:hypothetical protein
MKPHKHRRHSQIRFETKQRTQIHDKYKVDTEACIASERWHTIKGINSNILSQGHIFTTNKHKWAQMKLTRTDINPKLTQNSTNQTKATNVHEHKQPNGLVHGILISLQHPCKHYMYSQVHLGIQWLQISVSHRSSIVPIPASLVPEMTITDPKAEPMLTYWQKHKHSDNIIIQQIHTHHTWIKITLA